MPTHGSAFDARYPSACGPSWQQSERADMITGPIKSQIDQIWNAFWSGGISNPIKVIEQITYQPRGSGRL